MLQCIVMATKARISLLWAGEAFDMDRKAKAKKKGSAPLKRRRSISSARQPAITVDVLVEYLQNMNLAQIQKDLQSCLNAHPWTADAFSSFLQRYAQRGKVNVAVCFR